MSEVGDILRSGETSDSYRSPDWLPETGVVMFDEAGPSCMCGGEVDLYGSSRQIPATAPSITRDVADQLLRQAANAVERLARLDPAAIDPTALGHYAVEVERIGRMSEAAARNVVGHVDRNEPFRSDGFFNAKSWAKHRTQVSGPTAHRRVQSARFLTRVPLWAEATNAGWVGVDQVELMARLAANPCITDDTLEQDRWDLLLDAMDLPFDDFERRVRRWAMLADPIGAENRADAIAARRRAHVRARPEGGWDVTAQLDDISGAEFNEILAHFLHAEWEADWAEARSRLGDAATGADLRRTQDQRAADALITMARAAATSGGDPSKAVPTVNILFDSDTFEATLKGEAIPTSKYRDVICRVQGGQELLGRDAAAAALWGHIRRVLVNSESVVTDMSRRERFFRGAAREAVMLLALTCFWPGCDRPVNWCQADHTLSWRAHGATVPRNGGPGCGRHNRMKEHGYTVRRDAAGKWHTSRPDGTEIL